MSELWDFSPKTRAMKMVRNAEYQSAVRQLLLNCRAKTSLSGMDVAAPSIVESSREGDFEPPSVEVEDIDMDSDWDNLCVEVYAEGSPDADGKEELASLALTQYLAEDLEFTKEYKIIFGRGLHWVEKHNYIYDPFVPVHQNNFHEFENREIVGEDEIEELDDIVDDAN